MNKWLEWSIYTILAIIGIALLVSGGLVFLALGVIICLMIAGALLIGGMAYLIKELWYTVVLKK